MDNAVEAVFPEHPLQGGPVPDIRPVKWDFSPRQKLHPLLGLQAGVGEIIQADHLVSRPEQLHLGMGTDIPGAAGNQDLHSANPPLIPR